ncbi:SPFH domain-containing protein [Streptomyces sp. 8L]|uniref:SPFH domain-containing protein n=1 Tax=Streptomyces sp. 8L TaxID=2877242 RepID=UPI001CD3CE92|nr:SPFH domain-containing protein [Streptomyces sp. 8L]MCA1219827.1 membrane protease subunit [Streptomyces sp. 8L]
MTTTPPADAPPPRAALPAEGPAGAPVDSSAATGSGPEPGTGTAPVSACSSASSPAFGAAPVQDSVATAGLLSVIAEVEAETDAESDAEIEAGIDAEIEAGDGGIGGGGEDRDAGSRDDAEAASEPVVRTAPEPSRDDRGHEDEHEHGDKGGRESGHGNDAKGAGLPGIPGAVRGPGGGLGSALALPATPAEGDWAFADRPGGGDALVGALAGSGTARRGPRVVGEATHEIPVHLLFRDEVDPSLRKQPTVVGRRLGTGEQPRIRRTGPPTRPETPLDPKFNERPGPALPGWAAAFAGALTLVGCLALLWRAGALPDLVTEMAGLAPYPYHGIGIGQWLLLTLGVIVLLFTLGGLSRGRVGHALVLTLFGEYRGSVRRTGLLWISPLLLRRRVDVRLRHWRSEPMPAMDANGTALRVVVLVVWRVRDTVRATLGIRDHEEYLREQVEAALARVLSQLPADAFHGASPTLRNVEAVGDSLIRVLSTECRAAGIEVFSAQPTRIEYAPEIADVMRRSRIAAIDARHRDTVLGAVVDAVDDTVHRLTARGLVDLDDYERKALVKDLTVAFYTGRAAAPGERL